MKISVGDSVSFVNEKLDGVVRAIVNNQLVKVEIDDGFIIDADVKQLVVTKKFISGHKEIINHENNFLFSEEVFETKENTATAFDVAANTIQFITAPAEENKIMSGNINFYLLNNTSIKILFTVYAFGKKKATLIESGKLEKQTQKLFATKSRTDVFDFNYFTVQILFCNENSFMRPVVKDVPLQLPDFKSASKNQNTLLSFAHCFLIADLNVPEEIPVELLKQKLETKAIENFTSPLSALKQKKKTHDSGAVLLNSKEVDLHIEELIAEFSHLSNSEILSIQLKRFNEELNHAIANNFKSIIFIHGVGNGKLKIALQDELKNYPHISFAAADYFKYGMGATEVYLD